MNVACLYARAADLAERGAGRSLPLAAREPASRYREQAVAALAAALRQVAQGQRRDFWRQNVEGEPALVPLRGSGGMLRLERTVPR